MPLSQRAFFGLLDDSNPRGSDSRTLADDQFQEVLASMKEQCPNWTNVVNATHADVNGLTGFAAGGVKPMPGQGGVTVLYAYNADTPPLGWTVEEPDANLRELVIGPAAGGGTIGGTMDPTNMVDANISVAYPAATQGHGLVAEENGPHTHTGTTNGVGDHAHQDNTSDSAGSGAALTNSGNGLLKNSTAFAGAHSHGFTTDLQGSGQPHSHNIGGSTTASATMTPRYARGILMRLAV